MPIRLNISDFHFETQFAEFLQMKRESAADVSEDVAKIINQVRFYRDDAVCSYAAKFDNQDFTPGDLRLSADDLAKAARAVSVEARDALKIALERIMNFHQQQVPKDQHMVDADGLMVGYQWRPIASVGLYVPGGKGAYPSTVLMTAAPAIVAGAKRIAMMVPMPKGGINPLIAAAAELVGIQEVYKVGGAHGIAALALGTDSIPAVDKIVGPGNAYVTAAKRQMFGTVGIDMIAGPSEILVLADAANDPRWIAADLLSQAEHDENAQAILMTDDIHYAGEVESAIEKYLSELERSSVAAAAWQNYGAIILVDDLAEAPKLIDRIAPEHLELAIDSADQFANSVNNSGAIFLGRYTPEALGDYIAGPSHVLPTSRSARFSSGLSVLDFMKRTSIVRCDAASLALVGPTAAILAEAEGFGAHALSVQIRLNDNKNVEI